ncbi:hypothetical protein C8T65DRAFT_832498 [Cerioporus squamosus]|nr:hypothetical protein C8T65DRAFT_832498 [Cerioporus squamosus]
MPALTRRKTGVQDLRGEPIPDRSSFLSLVYFHVVNHPRAEVVLTLLAMISSPKLLSVVVNNSYYNTEPARQGPQELVAVCDLLPLRFPTLKRFEVDICTQETPISVTDNVFAPFATGWAHLVILRILTHVSSGFVTLKVLLEIADGCPRLEELCIPRLDVNHTSLRHVALVPSSKHGLQVLCVQKAVIADDDACAGVIDRIFPELDTIASAWDFKRVGDEWKRMVHGALIRCQESRRKRTRRQGIDHDEDDEYI